MNLEDLKLKLKKLINNERFEHSLGVMDYSIKLAEYYNQDVEKATIAGLLHDCAKQFKDEISMDILKKIDDIDDIIMAQKKLWHAPVGAWYVKNIFKIDDPIIYDAIYYHTIGKVNMPPITKIVYIADMIEEGRDKEFKCAKEIRELAFVNIDEAILKTVDKTIYIILEREFLLHPQSIAMRNDILLNRKK